MGWSGGKSNFAGFHHETRSSETGLILQLGGSEFLLTDGNPADAGFALEMIEHKAAELAVEVG